MRTKNKVVSLICAFAMIMTMLSSLVVVNAEGKPGLYTKVTENENGYTVVVGYENMPADTAVQSIDFGVKTPEGLKVVNTKYTDGLNGAPVINTATAGYVYFSVAALPVSTAANQDVLTIEYEVETAPAKTTTYDFEVVETYISANNDTVTFDQAKDDFAVTTGSATKYVETTDPAIYVKATDFKKAGDEVTVVVGYKNFPADTTVQSVDFGVKLPEGFTVVADSAKYADGLNGAPVINTATDGYVYFSVAALPVSTATEQEILTFKVTYAGEVTDGQKFTFDVVEGYISANNDTVTFDQSNDTLAIIPGISTVGSSEPTTSPEPSTSPEPGDNKIKSVTLDATSKAAKAGDKVTFNVTVDGTGDKAVTATAKLGDADVAADVKGSVVTVTVPSDAKEGDKIELVVTAKADATKFAKATITVIDPVIDIKPVEKTEVTMNGEKVKMFVPNITAVAGKDVAAKFTADQTYRVVFDFTKKDGTTVGKAVTSISGAQVKLLAEGDTSVEVFADALGAEVATIHFEDSKGKVIQ